MVMLLWLRFYDKILVMRLRICLQLYMMSAQNIASREMQHKS